MWRYSDGPRKWKRQKSEDEARFDRCRGCDVSNQAGRVSCTSPPRARGLPALTKPTTTSPHHSTAARVDTYLPLPLFLAWLTQDHVEPCSCARHADVVDADEDHCVILEALEAGNRRPGDVFERGAAEVGDVVFREAAEADAVQVRVFFGAEYLLKGVKVGGGVKTPRGTGRIRSCSRIGPSS